MKVLVLLFAVCMLVGTHAIRYEKPIDIHNDSNSTMVGCSPLSCSQMQSLVKKYFPASYQTDMICIAHYESSWCPSAYNGICCYGLWQINKNHLGTSGCPSSVSELYNADANAKCAAKVLASQGLNAWTTWSSGDCRHWSGCKA